MQDVRQKGEEVEVSKWCPSELMEIGSLVPALDTLCSSYAPQRSTCTPSISPAGITKKFCRSVKKKTEHSCRDIVSKQGAIRAPGRSQSRTLCHVVLHVCVAVTIRTSTFRVRIRGRERGVRVTLGLNSRATASSPSTCARTYNAPHRVVSREEEGGTRPLQRT